MVKTNSTSKNVSAHKKGTLTSKSKGKGTVTQEQLLGVIAHVASLHQGKAPLSKVARQLGYGGETNGSFKKALNRKKKAGLLSYDSTAVWLMEAGRSLAGDASEYILTNQKAQEKIMEDVTPSMKKAAMFLINGKPVTLGMLATHLEYDGVTAGFKKLVNRMKLKDLVESVGKDQVQLTGIAFPEGRPE